jgi:hypothetical protein
LGGFNAKLSACKIVIAAHRTDTPDLPFNMIVKVTVVENDCFEELS